ncbi:hypothetical protein EV129_111160 [Rhizobium azibense]|uniref:Uncharacterized protein n=1 Tax=Rhizobium azibense TaxID=1136135 RepID=A0A4R3RGX2_9HYPH|nr:hypothetical protein EV129_111160 [Rhizobium azibense]
MVNLSLGIFLALAEVFPRTNCSQIKFISAIDYTRELDAASFPVCFFSANPSPRRIGRTNRGNRTSSYETRRAGAKKHPPRNTVVDEGFVRL